VYIIVSYVMFHMLLFYYLPIQNLLVARVK